jgi:hypothetical protein
MWPEPPPARAVRAVFSARAQWAAPELAAKSAACLPRRANWGLCSPGGLRRRPLLTRCSGSGGCGACRSLGPSLVPVVRRLQRRTVHRESAATASGTWYTEVD